MGTETTASLYERLGRHEGIARITRQAIANHLANPLVNARFAHIPDMDRVERHAIEFFCAGSGGPEAYGGKDMRSTHRGMNISEQEFTAVLDDILAALRDNHIEAQTQAEVLGVLWSFKGEVVRG